MQAYCFKLSANKKCNKKPNKKLNKWTGKIQIFARNTHTHPHSLTIEAWAQSQSIQRIFYACVWKHVCVCVLRALCSWPFCQQSRVELTLDSGISAGCWGHGRCSFKPPTGKFWLIGRRVKHGGQRACLGEVTPLDIILLQLFGNVLEVKYK